MFIQAVAGADAGPDEIAVQNDPDLGENYRELENMEVGGDNVNECKILQFFSFNINFITIIAF